MMRTGVFALKHNRKCDWPYWGVIGESQVLIWWNQLGLTGYLIAEWSCISKRMHLCYCCARRVLINKLNFAVISLRIREWPGALGL